MSDIFQHIDKKELEEHLYFFKENERSFTSVFIRTMIFPNDQPAFYWFDPDEYAKIKDTFIYNNKSYLYSQYYTQYYIHPLLINNKGQFYLFNAQKANITIAEFRDFSVQYLKDFEQHDPNEVFTWHRM